MLDLIRNKFIVKLGTTCKQAATAPPPTTTTIVEGNLSICKITNLHRNVYQEHQELLTALFVIDFSFSPSPPSFRLRVFLPHI